MNLITKEELLKNEISEAENQYVHDAKWYEENTPSCPYCGIEMRTVIVGKGPQQKIEAWGCDICGTAFRKKEKILVE